MLIERGDTERPCTVRLRPAYGGQGRGATLERSDVRTQTRQYLSLAVFRPAPRNGEEGFAAPVRAGALEPNATQLMTRTRTGARLWPRDPGQTTGRWGGGWGRLIHGTLSHQSRRRQLECRRVLFLF
jgi:hypothetical protein